ncbi:MAG: hypothetical protein ACKV2U_22590 [Bryobacteraceae bacterium]
MLYFLAGRMIGGALLTRLATTLAGVGTALDPKDKHTINVMYPAAFQEGYLRPEVRLEIGPLS